MGEPRGHRCLANCQSAGGKTGHAGGILRSTNRTLRITGLVGGLSMPVREDDSAGSGGPVDIHNSSETLAVQAFGVMGPNTGLRLIQDQFVAGHENCALRRHLYSVPPDLLKRLLSGVPAPTPTPPPQTGITGIETLLQHLLPGTPVPASRSRPGPVHRDWTTIMSFPVANGVATAGAANWMRHSRTFCRDDRWRRWAAIT